MALSFTLGSSAREGKIPVILPSRADDQKFIEGVLDKIRAARQYAISCGKPELDIEVDGGINAHTARLVTEAGANVLVAGSALFSAPDFAEAVRELRGQ